MSGRSGLRAVAVAAMIATLPLAAACGGGQGAAGTSTSGSSTGGSATAGSGGVTLASGASTLCSKAPASASVVATLTDDQSNWPDPTSATTLSPIMFNQTGQDGWSTPGTEGGRKAVQVIPGQDSSGNAYGYSELYFTTGGVVPSSVSNVMLCLEYYDGTAGADIAVQFSGQDTSGPVNGAYDAAPELYTTAASNKWLVGSYTMSGVNFGSGAENGHADFRVTGENANPFWVDKAWLVLSNVPTKPDQAAMPKPAGG